LQIVRFAKGRGRAGAAHLTFVVNHGRLIQIHAENWTAGRFSAPRITQAEALAILRDRAQLVSDPIGLTVEIADVSFATTDEPPGVYTGAFGAGYDTHTVYAFRFRLSNEIPTFAAYVDVESGALLDLFDDNRYEGTVRGGVFPRTSSEPETTVPFGDLTVSNSGSKVTDPGGGYEYTGGTATTSLSGAHFDINDSCGAPAASAFSDPGDIDLGVSQGTNCSFSASGHSTRAARNAFYHLNVARSVAKKWLGGGEREGRRLVRVERRRQREHQPVVQRLL